jgi:glucose-6-phosphate 1-dehydrogenase
MTRGTAPREARSMTPVVTPRRRASAASDARVDPRPADVFVAFGISGDLAKVMTFRSLYRLEGRGLLTCPVVGVAVDDWSVQDLRDHARSAIETSGDGMLDEAVFERFAARLSYVSGDFGEPETFKRVAAAIGGAQSPVFYLEIPPFLFGTVI